MTALRKYQRLESPGLWRAGPDAQRRDVIVSFGEASLVLSDSRSEMALAHWSLPALMRLEADTGAGQALYAPGEDATETLELDDPEMIAAIETVRGAIASRRAHPGRLRGLLVGGALLAVLAGGTLWLPGAIIRHTAQVVPPSKRLEIGQRALADLTRVTGARCTGDAQGRRALARLVVRLFGPRRVEIAVVPGGPVPAAYLPGGILILRADLIEDHDGPEVAAGYLLAAQARAADHDPLVPLLHWAGLNATLHLLTTGDLPPGSLHGYGAARLLAAEHAPPVPPARLLARFRNAKVPAAPYAEAMGKTSPDAGALSAGAGDSAPDALILPDDSWVALQGLCSH